MAPVDARPRDAAHAARLTDAKKLLLDELIVDGVSPDMDKDTKLNLVYRKATEAVCDREDLLKMLKSVTLLAWRMDDEEGPEFKTVVETLQRADRLILEVEAGRL